MDREAWRAAIHGVTKSWTRLSDWTELNRVYGKTYPWARWVVLLCNHQVWRRRQWHPTPVLLPGKSHGWRSLEGCSPWRRWGSDTTERLHFHFSLLCIGEGNGNPLQCSCLENPRDGGAWWAAICVVAQNQTRLMWLSSSSSSSISSGVIRKKSLSFSLPWELQTLIFSLRSLDWFLLLGDPRLLINMPRNWLSHSSPSRGCFALLQLLPLEWYHVHIEVVDTSGNLDCSLWFMQPGFYMI